MTGPERETRRVAYLAVRRALKDKTLVRETCEQCAYPSTHAHHRWGYKQPLRVVWLCPFHHDAEHREMKLAQPRRFYREPKHWQYSENTGPTVVVAHLARLIGFLTPRERENALRHLARMIERQVA